MKKIKICCVIPSLQAGGMERVMSILVDQFTLNPQLEIHLILYGSQRGIFYPISSKVFVHQPAFRFNLNRRFLSTIRTSFFLRRIINRIKPSSVLSFGEYWNSLLLISLLWSGQNVFISDRCQPDKSYSPLHAILRFLLYPTSKGIISQTQVASDIYYKKFKHPNIRVIGNPISMIRSSNQNLQKRENIILSVGRLISSKNHDRLIKIFANVCFDDWKLVIVGGDSLKQQNSVKLRQLVSDLGLNNRIEIAGEQKNVAEYYLKSKIFAFSSSSEGFPNVVGEALSAGLPVVAYDCIAGPSEMIAEGENGFLITVYDDDAFAEKLLLLMKDEEKLVSMSEKAVLSVEKFSENMISQQFLSFITEV